MKLSFLVPRFRLHPLRRNKNELYNFYSGPEPEIKVCLRLSVSVAGIGNDADATHCYTLTIVMLSTTQSRTVSIDDGARNFAFSWIFQFCST